MSLFGKDPTAQPAPSPYARERIEREIAHLKKPASVRDPKATRRSLAAWLIVLTVGSLLWLFFMDPILHGFKRTDAIHAYLYQRNCGSDQKGLALTGTGVFTPNEIDRLNQRHGAFQELFPSPAAADQTTQAVIEYFKGVADLHAGRYEQLDLVGKIRYQLFVRFGLQPPTDWNVFDSSVTE